MEMAVTQEEVDRKKWREEDRRKRQERRRVRAEMDKKVLEAVRLHREGWDRWWSEGGHISTLWESVPWYKVVAIDAAGNVIFEDKSRYAPKSSIELASRLARMRHAAGTTVKVVEWASGKSIREWMP